MAIGATLTLGGILLGLCALCNCCFLAQAAQQQTTNVHDFDIVELYRLRNQWMVQLDAIDAAIEDKRQAAFESYTRPRPLPFFRRAKNIPLYFSTPWKQTYVRNTYPRPPTFL